MTDLPNYQQIKAWLGPGWKATNRAADIGEVPKNWGHKYWPAPWYLFGSSYICYLLHTDGTRVEVRAPSEEDLSLMTEGVWRNWFKDIERHRSTDMRLWMSGSLMDECITWHGPPAAENPTDEVTTLGELTVGEWCMLAGDTNGPGRWLDVTKPVQRGKIRVGCGDNIWLGQNGNAELYSARSDRKVRRVPPPQTSAGSGDAATRKDAGEVPSGAENIPSPQSAVSSPDPSRWPNADPAWIPALEAKLADQLKSGGYDCVEQRSLMVRAMRLAEEERERAKRGDPYTKHRSSRPDWNGRVAAVRRGSVPGDAVTSGHLLSRFELPDSQRLDRKRTGR